INFNHTFPVLLLFVFMSCRSEDSGHLIDNWEIGTYTGILDNLDQETFQHCREIGIRYLEISSGTFLNKTDEEKLALVDDLKLKAENANIEFWSIHLPFSKTLDISIIDEELRSIVVSEHIKLMKILEPLGLKKFVIHPSAEPVDESEREMRLSKCIESLRILTEEVKKYNANLALEVLPRTCLGNTSTEILKIVHAVNNNLEICFDTNHPLQESPEEFAKHVGRFISTVHVSDYDGENERHWIPGRGIIHWSQVIQELVNINYKGPWMYEVVPRKDDEQKPTPKNLVDTWNNLKREYLNFKR